MTTRADAVITGHVLGIEPLNPGNSFVRFYEIQIAVEDNLLGNAKAQASFVTTHQEPYEALKSSGHQAVFFLVDSASDFNRRSYEYFYARSRYRCSNVIDVDDETTSVPSFDRLGLREVVGGNEVLRAIKHQLENVDPSKDARFYRLREPDQRAFSGYDSFLAVPTNYENLIRVAAEWSERGGKYPRVANEIRGIFSPIVDFNTVKAQYADVEQVGTQWHLRPGIQIDTLEWMARDSDLIATGTIQDLVLTHLGEFDENGHQSSLDRHLVKLKVATAIKGEAKGFLSFEVDNGGKLADWKRSQTPLLIFLKDRQVVTAGEGMKPFALTYVRPEPVLRFAGRGTSIQAVVPLDDDCPPMFSSRLNWTSDPDEILSLIELYFEAVPSAREPGSRHRGYVSFHPPPSFVRRTKWSGNQHVRMRFPIDANLEKRAIAWIESENVEQRWLGAYALVYFKSKSNAERLKGLLDDPGQWSAPVLVDMYSHLRVRCLVRWEAWTILHAWGDEASKPAFN